MKIGGRSGHNPYATGASGRVDEVKEDQKIFAASMNYLKTKHEFVNCYPGNMPGVDTELMWGINKANANGVTLFYSVHLNKAYDDYDGAIGTEIWLHPMADRATQNTADRILKNFEQLGFKNRGIKFSNELAELNSTNMNAMIIECFFCEASVDVSLYQKHGANALGFAIANGIDPSIQLGKEDEDMFNTIVLYFGDMDAYAAIYVAQKNQCPMMKVSDFNEQKLKAKRIIQIGGKPNTNRYDSLKEAAKLV